MSKDTAIEVEIDEQFLKQNSPVPSPRAGKTGVLIMFYEDMIFVITETEIRVIKDTLQIIFKGIMNFTMYTVAAIH